MVKFVWLFVLTAVSFVQTKNSTTGHKLANQVVSWSGPPVRIIDGLSVAETCLKMFDFFLPLSANFD